MPVYLVRRGDFTNYVISDPGWNGLLIRFKGRICVLAPVLAKIQNEGFQGDGDTFSANTKTLREIYFSLPRPQNRILGHLWGVHF